MRMVHRHPGYADTRFRPLPRRASGFLDIVFEADIPRSLVAVIIEAFDLDRLESDKGSNILHAAANPGYGTFPGLEQRLNRAAGNP
jgi:hypothetical protein